MGKIFDEGLLLALALRNKGGGGGTTDYNELSNKPKIEGQELKGDLSFSDFGYEDATDAEFKEVVLDQIFAD